MKCTEASRDSRVFPGHRKIDENAPAARTLIQTTTVGTFRDPKPTIQCPSQRLEYGVRWIKLRSRFDFFGESFVKAYDRPHRDVKSLPRDTKSTIRT